MNAAGASAWSNEAAVTTPATTAQAAYGGTAWAVGADAAGTTIQAEDFDVGGEGNAYHDLTTGNTANLYRPAGVDVGSHPQDGGGYFVGWAQVGEWLEYTVNVTRPGTYRLDARVGRPTVGGTFHVEFGGIDRTGPLVVPATNSYYTFATVTKAAVPLAAGVQVMRVKVDALAPNGTDEIGNFDWLRLVPETMPGDAPTAVTAVAAGPGTAYVQWRFAGGGGTGGAGPAANVYRSTSLAALFDPANRVASGVTDGRYTDAGLTNGVPYYYGVRPVLPAGGGEGVGTVANGGAPVVTGGPVPTDLPDTPGAWPRLLPDPRGYTGTTIPLNPTVLLPAAGPGPHVLVSPVAPVAYRGQQLLLGAALNYASTGTVAGATYDADYVSHRATHGATNASLFAGVVNTAGSVPGQVALAEVRPLAALGRYHYAAYAVGGQPYGASPAQTIDVYDGPPLLVTDLKSGYAQRDATADPATLGADGSPGTPFAVGTTLGADGKYRSALRLDVDEAYLDLPTYSYRVSGPGLGAGVTGSLDPSEAGRAVTLYLYPGQTYTVSLAGTSTGYGRSITVATEPEPPMPLTAVAAPGAVDAVDLTWVPHTWGATGFVVERTTDPAGGAWQTVATLTNPAATSHRDVNVPPELTYAYRVRPTLPGGAVGRNSDPVTVSLGLPAPTGLTVVQDDVDGALVLAWADTTGTETGFAVERSLNGGPFEAFGSTGANVATFRTGGIPPAGSYVFRVVASGNGRSSVPSASAAVVVPPPVGQVAAAIVSGTGAVVSWPAPSAGATGYRVQRQAEGGTAWEPLAYGAGGGAISYKDPTTAGPTRYRYRVAADAGGVRSAYVEGPLADVLDPAADTDNDGLTNAAEYAIGTAPGNFDTDGDLLADGWEDQYRPAFDPLVAGDFAGDADGDGVDNLDEFIYGADPTSGDTDGDGASDQDEIDDRADPTDPEDDGEPPPPEEQAMLRLTVGDDSGSHSERWALKVGPYTFVARTHGEVAHDDFPFDVGETYKVQVLHLPPSTLGSLPDYDYEAHIDPVPGEPVPVYSVTNNYAPSLLQPGVFNGDDVNHTLGKVEYLHIGPGGPVDLAIDSDNDGQTQDAADGPDDQIEDAADKPGRIVAVSGGDADGDGMPDFADFGAAPDGGSLVPVRVRLPRGLDDGAKVQFTYAGSDPAAVERTGAGTPADPYAYEPANGRLRLWLRDTDEGRDPADAAAGGDYVVPDQEYDTPDLGFDGQGLATLWLEAVTPSAGLGDGSVGVRVTGAGEPAATVGSDAVRATAFTTRVVAVNADGSVGTEDKVTVTSPAPTLSGTSVTVGNLRFGADHLSIYGDVTVTGSLDDELLDLISGSEGRIDSVSVFLNGATEALATVPTTVSKAVTPGDDLLKPYDFSATFSGTLAGVELQPGWNAFQVVAVNAAGHTGSVDASAEVVVTPPPDESYEFDIRFPGGSSSPGGAATLDLRYSVDGGPANGPETLTRVGATNEYAGAGGTVSVTLDGGWAGPADRTAMVTLPAAGLVGLSVDFDDGANPGTFLGAGERMAADRKDYTHYSVAPGQNSGPASGVRGPIVLNAVEIVGPVGLHAHLGDLSVGENGAKRGVARYRDRMFVANPFEPWYRQEGRPDLFVAWSRPSTLGGYPADVTPRAAGADKTFQDGLADGLVRPFVEMKETAVGIADIYHKAVEWAANQILALNAERDPYRVALKIGLTVAADAQKVVAATRRAVDVTNGTLGAILILGDDLANRPLDAVKSDLIAGTHLVYILLPSEVKDALLLGAEVVTGLIDHITNLSAYDKGWYLGYAITTITMEVVSAALTAGVGTAAVALSKLQLLKNVAPKLIKAGGHFAATMADIGVDAAGNVAPVATKFAHALEVTRMCFVPGTLVHTAAGLVPIEEVREGDRVWSRDEATGAWGYKPVTDTFVTHPDTIYRVAFDPDGDGALPAETLGTTAPHPFYVSSRDGDGDGKPRGFVPAGELVVGDQLVLADGSSAWVTGVAVERAAAGEAFTTHNFAVADFHTYFVGAGGVWVHNASSFNCEQFFSHVEWMRKKDGGSKRQAFEKVLRLSDPDLHTPGSPGYDTAKRLAAKYDPHLATAAREVMEDAYTRAVQGGVVDLSQVPTAKQLYEAMGFEYQSVFPGSTKLIWKNGRASASALEVHHTASKRVAGELLFKRQNLPVSESVLDDMPGFLINDKVTRLEAGPPHQALTTAINNIRFVDAQTLQPRTIAQVFDDMAAAYAAWDPQVGPKVWQVAEKWFESRGVHR